MKLVTGLLLLSAIVGCELTNTRPPILEDIEWYSLPYNIPKETGVFGGKSWKNQELFYSGEGIIWPYSHIFDSDETFPRIRLFYHKGKCYLWFDSSAPWVKKSCCLYSVTKDVVWLRLRRQVIINDRGQKVDCADVEEISEEEFYKHAKEIIPGIRYLKLRGRQVVIGSCGRLRGYVLNDLEPTYISLELKRFLNLSNK